MTRSLPTRPTEAQRAEADGILRAAGLGDMPHVLPAPGRPVDVARELLLKRTEGGVHLLQHWRDDWWRHHQGTHWAQTEQAEVDAWLYCSTEKATYLHPTKSGDLETRPWAPNRSRIGDLRDALAKIVLLPASVDAPAWLDDRRTPAADQLIPVRNGLLEVDGSGGRVLHPCTPALFNRYALPFDFDPRASRPAAWLAFLDQLWPGEPDAVAALQEWFGYVLSGRTELQKILLLVGPQRSGKGTIARVLAELVGKGNHAGPTLGSLGTNFGLQPLLGKPLAIVSDARLSTKADVATITERLLSISGEDALTVDRKFREAWTGTLGTRFMVLSNELPRLGDASGAIASRFVILTLGRSWLGHEDPGLTKRLRAELPSILCWALDGLDRLTERGAFVEPASSADSVAALAELVSPVGAFVRERCEVGDYEVSAEVLYGEWARWAANHGHHAGSATTFPFSEHR